MTTPNMLPKMHSKIVTMIQKHGHQEVDTGHGSHKQEMFNCSIVHTVCLPLLRVVYRNRKTINLLTKLKQKR